MNDVYAKGGNVAKSGYAIMQRGELRTDAYGKVEFFDTKEKALFNMSHIPNFKSLTKEEKLKLIVPYSKDEKFADGGEVKNLIRERNELLNDMYNNEDTEVESSDIVKVGDVLYGDDVNGYVRIVKEVNDPLKGDYFVLQDRFDNKFAFYITQIIRDLYKKELKIQNVNVSEKDFLYSDEVVNIKKELEFHKGRVNIYKKNPNDASNYSGISYSDYVGSESKIKKLEENLKSYLKDEKHNFANGGMFDDNDGFMKADNNNNYRYPEMEVYVETLDEPIDLTNNVSSRTNEVVIKPLDEKIDLNDDNRVRARMGFEPKNRTPEKMMMVNPRMIVNNLPTPMSNTHKND